MFHDLLIFCSQRPCSCLAERKKKRKKKNTSSWGEKIIVFWPHSFVWQIPFCLHNENYIRPCGRVCLHVYPSVSGRGWDGPAALLWRSGEGRWSDTRQRHCAATIRPQEEIPPVRCQDIIAVGGPQDRWGGRERREGGRSGVDTAVCAYACVDAGKGHMAEIFYLCVCVSQFASSGELMMSLFWYYRPEHTQGGRDPSAHCEVRRRWFNVAGWLNGSVAGETVTARWKKPRVSPLKTQITEIHESVTDEIFDIQWLINFQLFNKCYPFLYGGPKWSILLTDHVNEYRLNIYRISMKLWDKTFPSCFFSHNNFILTFCLCQPSQSEKTSAYLHRILLNFSGS